VKIMAKYLLVVFRKLAQALQTNMTEYVCAYLHHSTQHEKFFIGIEEARLEEEK